MLWTEEQSAIGGLMLSYEGTPGVIGFERFFNHYADNFSLWFASFEQDFERSTSSAAPDYEKSRRPWTR